MPMTHTRQTLEHLEKLAQGVPKAAVALETSAAAVMRTAMSETLEGLNPAQYAILMAAILSSQNNDMLKEISAEKTADGEPTQADRIESALADVLTCLEGFELRLARIESRLPRP